MTVIKRFVCWLKKRHSEEEMVKNASSFHQFYGVRGGGRIATCPHCGKVVFLRRTK